MAASKRKYFGGCHCGAVRWEADLDLSAGYGKCNCTICHKSSYCGMILKPGEHRVLSGEDSLSVYTFNSKSCQHLFCKVCGVKSFSRGDLPGILGEYVTINVACLDGREGLDAKGIAALDAIDAEVAKMPVKTFDGRHDKWT